MAKTTFKLGDLVTAEYGDVTVTGILSGFDGSGYAYLDFETPQDLGNRIEPKGVAIDPWRRATMKLVKAGPALTQDDILELPYSCMGIVSLRKKSA